MTDRPTPAGLRFHSLFPVLVLLTSLGGLSACGDDPVASLDADGQKRYVRLDGAANFRDLGGHATGDGHRVRWGLFYRSDALADLSDADLEIVRGLGLRLVCDLRSAEEKADEPDRLPQPAPAVAEIEVADDSFAMNMLRDRITSGDLGDLDLRQMLIDGNAMFATRFSPQYRALFERITKQENLPALVHCTGGKDRAGFASALILRTLGVPMETVYEDFLATNIYTAKKIDRMLLIIRVASLFRTDPEAVRPVLGVERAYLESAFAAIDREHGDFDTYRRTALGISDEELGHFRALALD